MSYIKNHNKQYFLDETYLPNFKLGRKNVSAILLPHAGSHFVKEIFDFAFNKINIKPFNKIILLTTNHYTNNNVQMDNIIKKIKLNKIDGIPIDSDFFKHEHSYLSILPYLEKIGYPCTIISVGEYNNLVGCIIFVTISIVFSTQLTL